MNDAKDAPDNAVAAPITSVAIHRPLAETVEATRQGSETVEATRQGSETIELLEEQLTVSKRQVAGDTVTISTRTETREETAELALERGVVDVVRVPIDRHIDAMPMVRHDGDTMIVPVVEERLVVTKQLFLVEELHIRQRVEQEMVQRSVPLRRQHVVVERTDADGKRVDWDASTPRPKAN